MKILSAVVFLSVAAGVRPAEQTTCDNPIYCACGSTGRSAKVCPQEVDGKEDPCSRWSECKTCQDGSDDCLECPDGLDGQMCSTVADTGLEMSPRQERQYYNHPPYHQTRPRRPVNNPYQPNRQGPSYPTRPQQQQGVGSCPELNSPKYGSIKCTFNYRQKTCVGTCIPGYTFEGHGSEDEITLKCTGGYYTPFNEFPPCKSGGYCDLTAVGSGSFNCTADVGGTLCDIICDGRFKGRYFCYPGHHWEPHLPYCMEPKEVDDVHEACNCEYGGSCDYHGNCVCPVGRTGRFCEKMTQTCNDPGFLENGIRKNPDDSDSSVHRTFNEGESVVYSCTSEEYALQGSPLLSCKNNGMWSSSLPKCIKTPSVPVTQTCNDPGFVKNGLRKNLDESDSSVRRTFDEGESVVYSCISEEYALQGSPLLSCKNNGMWSSPLPKCIRTTSVRPLTGRLHCIDPGVDPNGSRNPQSPPSRQGFPQGSSLEYSCNQGYNLSGEKNVFCVIPGKWSSARPTCKRRATASPLTALAYCRDPGVDPNGSRKPQSPASQRGFPQGSSLVHSCNQGYDLNGERTVYCLTSGKWSSARPTCTPQSREPAIEPAYCLNPGPIWNGRVVYYPPLNSRRGGQPQNTLDEEEYPYGGRLEYSCDSGYSLDGYLSLICQENGEWSEQPPVCTKDVDRVYCLNPGASVTNGQVVYYPPLTTRGGVQPQTTLDDPEYPMGARLEYSCNSRYTLRGYSNLTCKEDGDWSTEAPVCEEGNAIELVYCLNPGNILNGQVVYYPQLNSRQGGQPQTNPDEEEYPYGGRLEYSCDSGYSLDGYLSLICQENGEWSEQPPVCTKDVDRVYCPNPGANVTNGQVVYYPPLSSRGGEQSQTPLDDPEYPLGARLEYSCERGYFLHGHFNITCDEDGEWSTEPPDCEKSDGYLYSRVPYCPEPGMDPRGSRDPPEIRFRYSHAEGTRFTYSCNEGYVLEGEPRITCLRTKEWSSPRPKCKTHIGGPDIVYCPFRNISDATVAYYPPSINGEEVQPLTELTENEYPNGSRIESSCRDGYIMDGNSSLTCKSDGKWTAALPVCLEIARIRDCNNPEPVPNSRVVHVPAQNVKPRPLADNEELGEYPQGSRLTYFCNDGYFLQGESNLTCGEYGQWSPEPPNCFYIGNLSYCANPGPVLNGKIEYYSSVTSPGNESTPVLPETIEYLEGTRLDYECDEGYIAEGPFSLTCESTGMWSDLPPTCVSDCGRSVMGTNQTILHGEKTEIGEWPWVVAIGFRVNNSMRIFCGGAVLNTRTVITAAHCLDFRTGGSRFILLFGKYHHNSRLDDAEVLVRVSDRVILHPDYNNRTWDSDIALITFKPKIKYSPRVQHICLPTAESTAKNLVTGQEGYVTGWGNVSARRDSDELLMAHLPFLPNSACLESLRENIPNYNPVLTQNMFCAGYPEGNHTTCRGDSGSPLVYYDPMTGRHTLEGLFGFGVPGQCDLARRYSVFTKVSNFLPWIYSNLG